MNGSIYLPYRHHYTPEQLEKAYGVKTLEGFMACKQKYDPQCLFSSLWLRGYGSRYVPADYQALILRDSPVKGIINEQQTVIDAITRYVKMVLIVV
jgi:hypothetical protein